MHGATIKIVDGCLLTWQK